MPGPRKRSLLTAPLIVLALIAAGLAATSALAASAAPMPTLGASTSPVLGAKDFAGPDGEGWGTARPATIFNGGDPSGLVSDIHWRSWGGAQAIGWGKNSIFKPGGGYYRKQVAIELKAAALGQCGSRRAYTHLAFRVPKRPGGRLGPWRSWSGATTICSSPF
jgi:hypothetical protein